MCAAIVARHVHLLTPQKLSNLSALFHAQPPCSGLMGRVRQPVETMEMYKIILPVLVLLKASTMVAVARKFLKLRLTSPFGYAHICMKMYCSKSAPRS